MKKFLVSEGYINISYMDENYSTKNLRSPKYRLSIHAQSFELARYMCTLMLDGVEGKDYLIFERDEKLLGKEKLTFDTYMKN